VGPSQPVPLGRDERVKAAAEAEEVAARNGAVTPNCAPDKTRGRVGASITLRY
jgi:hypothetical protein